MIFHYHTHHHVYRDHDGYHDDAFLYLADYLSDMNHYIHYNNTVDNMAGNSKDTVDNNKNMVADNMDMVGNNKGLIAHNRHSVKLDHTKSLYPPLPTHYLPITTTQLSQQ